jgi:hypothetical protein
LKTTFSKKQFGPRNLFQDDFPHWCLPNAESILNLKVVELPNEYEALYPWTNEEPQTDAEGWKYSLSFYNTPWHTTCQSDSLIRRRVWHRVVVPITQAAAARTALNKFYSTCCSYRALNFQLIDRALCDFSHQFQIIYELQRQNIPNINARNVSTSGGAGGGGTSSYCHSPNVISSSDPIAAWSTLSNPIHDPSLDFSSSPPSSLDYVPINQVSFNCPPGWVVLHEFVHSVHPDSDEIGWVYSYSPSSSSPSQLQSQLQDQLQQSQNTHPVSSSVAYRRRKWFRTLVHVSNYSDCRLALTSYLTSHPRGLIKQGNLYKKSSFQHVWLSCSASLVDDELILSGSQENKSFPLHGLEVIPLKSHECIGYQAGFALRKKAYDHSVSDVLCSLTSDVISEVSVWMEALSHQIAFVNNDFNPFPFGPVISDPVLLTDDMWKRSDILQVWRLRTLQLHESGFLIYYHGGQIRDRIDLNGCRLYSNAQASSPTHASTLDSSSSKLLISSTSPTSSFDNSQPNGSDQERSFTVRADPHSLSPTFHSSPLLFLLLSFSSFVPKDHHS